MSSARCLFITLVAQTPRAGKRLNCNRGLLQVVGIILIPVGLFLIGWNEYRTVQTESAIDLGAEALVPADCDTLDPGLNGALVHLACDISGNGDWALNITVPPAITASQNGVDATEAQRAGIWATSDDASLSGSGVPLRVQASLEMSGWAQRETNCRNEKQRSGSKKTRRVCDYTTEKVWQSCGSPGVPGACSLQTNQWKSPDPRQNENWGVDPTNPLAGAEARVYSGSATLGSAYPLNSGTIESLAAGGCDGSPSCGVQEALPSTCSAVDPWDSQESLDKACAAEAGPTASLSCVDQSVGVVGAGQSGWTVGKCSGTKTSESPNDLTRQACLDWCNQQGAACCRSEASGGADADECKAHDNGSGNTIGPSDDSGDYSCNSYVAAPAPPCTLNRPDCSASAPSPPPPNTPACLGLPKASTGGFAGCCLDDATCGSASASRVGDRRVSFTVTYASDATVLAKQLPDGSFDKWVPEGIDPQFSPFDYISFGKADADSVLLEMRKLQIWLS